MQEKEALKAQITATASAHAVPLPAGAVDWRAWRFRTVTLEGTFDARRQILIDNAVHAGRVGYTIVTPLLLADGRAVLINRGFVVAGPSRAVLPDPKPPPGTVMTVGGPHTFDPGTPGHSGAMPVSPVSITHAVSVSPFGVRSESVSTSVSTGGVSSFASSSPSVSLSVD